MAIVDTVRGRLARFNPPHRGLRDNGSGGGDRNYRARLLDVAGAVLRGIGIAGVALIGISLLLARTLAPVARRWLRVLWRLTTNFAVFFSTRVVPVSARFSMRAASAGWRHLPAAIMVMRIPVLICCLALLGWAASIEMRTSHLQADLFTRLDHDINFTVPAGPSDAIAFPKDGPYDERLGYAELPKFTAALLAHRYAIDSQAKWSPGLMHFVDLGGFPIYHEKDSAGLRIFDRSGAQVYGAQYPGRTYPDFASVPPLVANSLSFVEDRYLLDPSEPDQNPAIEWKRFGLAVGGRIAGLVAPGMHVGGGSTLATQIEKFRHSTMGSRGGIGEKIAADADRLGAHVLCRRPGDAGAPPANPDDVSQFDAARLRCRAMAK
jgi:hypothetical protein